MMSEYSKFLVNVERLREYAEYTNDELGETCTALCNLSQYTTYMSDELVSVLTKEINGQLEWFDENMEFITKTETITHNIRSLEEKYE